MYVYVRCKSLVISEIVAGKLLFLGRVWGILLYFASIAGAIFDAERSLSPTCHICLILNRIDVQNNSVLLNLSCSLEVGSAHHLIVDVYRTGTEKRIARCVEYICYGLKTHIVLRQVWTTIDALFRSL